MSNELQGNKMADSKGIIRQQSEGGGGINLKATFAKELLKGNQTLDLILF